jgi:hypothetical protein
MVREKEEKRWNCLGALPGSQATSRGKTARCSNNCGRRFLFPADKEGAPNRVVSCCYQDNSFFFSFLRTGKLWLHAAPPFQATGNVIALEHRVRDWRYLCRLNAPDSYQVLILSLRGKCSENNKADMTTGLLVAQDILNMSKNY